MPTRCRNYNDNGTARQPCPLGDACRFIHPGQPAWDTARKYDHSSIRGRGGYRGRGGRGGSGSWGAPPSPGAASTSRKSDSGWGPSSKEISTSTSTPIPWDTSSWGIPRQNTQAEPSTSSNKTGTVPDNSAWGSPIGAGSKGVEDAWGAVGGSGSGSGWGSSSIDTPRRGGSGSWGAPPSPGAATTSTKSSSGWGSSWKETSTSVSAEDAWGASGERGSGSGWGSSSIDNNAWGASASSGKASGWEDTGGGGRTEDSTKSKGKRRDEAERGKGWNTGSSGWDATPQPQQPLQPPLPTTETVKERPRTVTPSPATSHVAGRIPLPGRKPSPATNLADAKQITKKTNSTSLKIRTQSLPAAEPLLSAVTDSARPRETPVNPAQVYSNTIRYIQQAVRLQIELEDAQANVERWKRTQTSHQFSRATPATREILDAQRAAYAQEAAEFKKQLAYTVKYLSELPDLSAHSKALTSDINPQELMAYTSNLRDWMRGLVLSDRITPPKPPSPPTVTERPKDPKELTWDKVVALEHSIGELSESASDALYTWRSRANDVDVDAELATLRKTYEAEKQNALTRTEASAQELLGVANQVGEDLGEVAEATAKVYETVHQNEQVLVLLNAELNQLEQVKAQMQSYLDKCEDWKQEDKARIEELKGRVQNLHKVARPARPPLTPDDLVPTIQTLVMDDLQNEVTVLVDRIREACSLNGHAFIAEITTQLEPILDMTEDVCRRANAITSARIGTQSGVF